MMKDSQKTMLKYCFSAAILVLGVLINQFNLGSPTFTIFGSPGNWLVYVGLVGLIMTTLHGVIRPKKRKVDERMLFVANKAMRVTFIVFITAAFLIILVDSIVPITMPYYLFMSYLVCGFLVTYYASYKILLKRH